MSAIEVLEEIIKEEQKNYEEHKQNYDELPKKYGNNHLKRIGSLKEVLLALEKQKNGLKCIGCGSIPKLKLCCNSCYQRLKLKEKRQVELKEWLEKEIEIIKQIQEEYGNKVLHEEIRKNILKEVLDRVGEQK